VSEVGVADRPSVERIRHNDETSHQKYGEEDLERSLLLHDLPLA
jgi:hypothetical protein